MNLIQKIQEAIHILGAMNVKRDEMTISCSALVERHIAEVLYKDYAGFLYQEGQILKLEGVELSNKFPYNKIVVWANKCDYFPHLMVEIEIIDLKQPIKQIESSKK